MIELHKQHGNCWTAIAGDMHAIAGAAPGAKTRRPENWVKNAFYAKRRKTNKADPMWAPLYAYQEACEAEGHGLASSGEGGDAAQLAGAEAAEQVVPQRRSTRATKKPAGYGDFDSDEEDEDEGNMVKQEEEEDALELKEEQPVSMFGLPAAPAQPWRNHFDGEGFPSGAFRSLLCLHVLMCS